jgi:hypothetical protein
MVSPTKLAVANMASGMIARSPRRRSMSRNAIIAIAPAATMTQPSRGSPAPSPASTVSPQVSAARAAVAAATPAQSSGASSSRRLSATYRQPSHKAPAHSGRLIRKIARHPAASTSQPPSTGPIAPAIAPAAAHVPIARPRASPANAAPSSARLFGISIAEAAPCNTRPATSSSSEGAIAHRSEAIANNAIPPRNSRLRP